VIEARKIVANFIAAPKHSTPEQRDFEVKKFFHPGQSRGTHLDI
jgi:hypothetical protein